MPDSNDLKNLKLAYRAWHDSRGADKHRWLDLMADHVSIRGVDEQSAGLRFATDRRSREEAVEYFTAILEDWEMIHWTPDVFVDDGERIAMFGHCSWRNRATGKAAEGATAHLWHFEDGKIVEFRDVFDTARAVAAATPDV